MKKPQSDPNGTDNQTEKVAEQILAAFVKWFGVSQFVDSEKAELKALILACLPSWNKRAEISVSEGEQQVLGEKDAPSAITHVLQKALSVDHREFASPLDAALHCLWVLQRLSHFEPWRDGMPSDGFRFREVIRESRKLLNSLGYEPGTWNEVPAPSVGQGAENQPAHPVSQNDSEGGRVTTKAVASETGLNDGNRPPSLPASKAGEETEEWRVVEYDTGAYIYGGKYGTELIAWLKTDAKEANRIVSAHNASLSGLKEADVTAQGLGEKDALKAGNEPMTERP